MVIRYFLCRNSGFCYNAQFNATAIPLLKDKKMGFLQGKKF